MVFGFCNIFFLSFGWDLCSCWLYIWENCSNFSISLFVLVTNFRTFLLFFSFYMRILWDMLVVLNRIGWGTDEKAIISILGRRNAIQRKLIRQAYEEMYQEDLIKRLESELSGDFEVLCFFLVCFFYPTPDCNDFRCVWAVHPFLVWLMDRSTYTPPVK